MAPRDPAKTAQLLAVIETQLASLGISEAEACRRAGLHRETIRNIRRGSTPSATKFSSLARALKLSPLALIGDAMADQPERPTPAGGGVVADSDPLVGKSGSRDLSLYRAKNPDKMSDITSDEAVGTIARPAKLLGRATAYGVYVDDDLNAPIVRHGHVAYIDPSRPAHIGSVVRAFVRGAPAIIAALEARTAGAVLLHVATEAKPRQVDADRIAKLERVVGFMLLDA